MEKLVKLLKDYGRFLELEDSIPYWSQQLPELKMRIRELRLNRDLKECDLKQLEDPNFFRRLFGRTEEKKEKLGTQLREITAALQAAQWELKSLEEKIASGKQELETLRSCRKIYAQAKQETALTSLQEGQLVMEEIAAFTPAALAAADRVLEALEDARYWMQQDALRKNVLPDNRKLEFLGIAGESALRLRDILSVMPEGCGSIGSYLRNPEIYIDEVTSEYKKLDRLNSAIDQVRETRNQLRMLQ